jgi:hypothetical protein
MLEELKMKMVLCLTLVLCVSCGEASSKDERNAEQTAKASPGVQDATQGTTQGQEPSSTSSVPKAETEPKAPGSSTTTPDPNKELDVKIGLADVDLKTIQTVTDQHAADLELQTRFTNLKTAFANLKAVKDEVSRIKFCAALSPVLTYVGTDDAFSTQERDLVQSAVTSLRKPENLCVPAASR